MNIRSALFASALLMSWLPAQNQNQVLDLNGTTDYAFTVITSGFNPNEISVECWIRPSAVPAGAPRREQRVLVKGSETFQSLLDGRFSLYYIEDGAPGATTGTLRFNVYLGSFIPNDQVQLDSSVPYAPEQWIHVAGTFSSITGQANLYVNGVLDNSTSMSLAGMPLLGQTMTSSPQPLTFGAVPFPNALAATAFRGQIDEVRVWSVVRSASEILTNTVVELTAGVGLIDAWNLNGNANGSSTMGIAFGSATYPIGFVPGIGGGLFPGQNECQLAATNATFGFGAFPGNGSAPAFTNALTGNIDFTSALNGSPWDLGITANFSAAPLFGAGSSLPDGQIVNLALGSGAFVWLQGGAFNVPFPGNFSVPFSAAGPGSIAAAQMVVVDPSTPSGLRLSNPGVLAPGL